MDTWRQHFQIFQWHTDYCLLLLLPCVTVSASLPSPVFPSYLYLSFFIPRMIYKSINFFKHGGYDGYTETALSDPQLAY